MQPYEIVFFDLDGTLLNFAKSERKSLIETLKAFDLRHDEPLISDYIRINRACWQRLERGDINASDIPTMRIKTLFLQYSISTNVASFNVHYKNAFSTNAFLVFGAIDILSYASAKANLQVVALTNGFTNMQHARLKNAKIRHYFDAVFTSEELGSFKPSTTIFLKAYEALKLSPTNKHALIVGDSLSSDIKGGINFGIDTCWFNPHAHVNHSRLAPTYEIKTLDDLKKIL